MRKLFSFLIVLFPFLCQFGLPVEVPFLTEHFSIGELVLIPFILIYFFSKIPTEGIFKVKLFRFCGYFAFSFLAIVFTACATRYEFASFSAAGDTVLSILYFCLLLYAAKGVFNIAFGMKIYSFFACVFSLYLIAQVFGQRFHGTMLPGVESLFPTLIGGPYADWLMAAGSPASLFLSVEAYALYCLPPLAFLLLWNRTGSHGGPFLSALVITLGILLSRAPLPMALAVGIWLVYIAVAIVYFIIHPVDSVYRFMHQGAPRICIQIFLFMASVTLLTIAVLDGKISQHVLPLVRNLACDEHLSSGFGFTSALFSTVGIRLHGCGIGNIPAALSHFGVDPAAAAGSLNTLGVALLSTGVIGFLSLLAVLFSLIATRRGKFGFTVACLLLVLSLFLNIAYTPIFSFLFLIAYSANDAEHSIGRHLRIR